MLMRQQMAGCCHGAGGAAGLDWATCGSANCVTAHQAATEAWGQTRAIAPPSLIFIPSHGSHGSLLVPPCPQCHPAPSPSLSAPLAGATVVTVGSPAITWTRNKNKNKNHGDAPLPRSGKALAVGCWGLRAAGCGLVRALAMQPCFASHCLVITAVTIQIKPSWGHLAVPGGVEGGG